MKPIHQAASQPPDPRPAADPPSRIGVLLRGRRGVVSILAMMFLVLFGSLGLAMAIVSKGNLRTASTQLHVTKAIGAAETGLAVAKRRLEDAAARFVVDRGQVTSGLGTKLWNGSMTSGDGVLRVLPNTGGYTETSTPAGIAYALINAHAADQNIVSYSGSVTVPAIAGAPAGADTTTLSASNWVVTPTIAIDGSGSDSSSAPAAFQITYAPLANGTDVRIIVTGFSSIGVNGSNYMYASDAEGGQPITRTIQQDFRIVKRHQHALLSPSRILIGKNVSIIGNVGERYDNTAVENGDPLVIKSDFEGLDGSLDAKLEAFYQGVQAYDVDGDCRLRAGHAVERQGIPSNATDYDSDGRPDNAFADATGDGYVDELDIFLNHYDRNRDGKVALSDRLRAGTPASALSAEFTVDDDLSLLIDGGNPDRNKNGVYGFADSNGNGRWDSGESINDYDAAHSSYPDVVLGWRDGVIDRKDKYAKVRGQLVFKTSRSAWESNRGHDYQSVVEGAVRPERGLSPTRFGAGASELPDLSASSFTSDAAALTNLANGQSFEQQVAAQLGVGTTALPTYVEARTDATQPRYWRSDLDNAYVRTRTGRDIYEKMPFNAPSFTDWYYRPRYENMVFRNVQIPRGNNGLFINCTFVGVTRIRTHSDNSHVNWSLYGAMQWSSSAGAPVFNTTALDKSDFARYTTNQVQDGPANYADFPNPPVIDGVTRTGSARNTKLYSNNIRFHDCLFVGSLVSDTPTGFTQVRNKTQFTGATRFSESNPSAPNDSNLNPRPEDLDEIRKSSLMLPNYSVDIGSFNSPTDTYTGSDPPPSQNVNLQGTIIAGVLDARGNTSIDGTLLLTFAPTAGVAPLVQNGVPIGNPANFNTSLGYLGPTDGDSESLDPNTLPVINNVRVAGWDTDGDGLADILPPQLPAQGQSATVIPFYGYGRVSIRFNPDHPMPDGILLPLSVVTVSGSYREGK